MALNVFGRFMPPEENFTSLFRQQAEKIVEAARELRAMVAAKDEAAAHVAAIRTIEMAADGVAKQIFIAANRTFNAPIDREDLLELAHDLDDAVDLIEDTAKGIARYGVRAFPPPMHAMADAVVECAEVLLKVMPHLDSITRDHKTIFSLCESVGQIEGRADDALESGLLALRLDLREGRVDTIGYIDRKELYELIESVVDKCDDVANAVESIAAKHV